MNSVVRPNNSTDDVFRYVAPLDGLRALAVLAVVFFHARGDQFPGGNIGVDLFFVLSGFLITTLLLSELRSTGRLHLRAFYARRALRLLPALVLACSGLALFYWLTPLVPDRHASLVGTAAAAAYLSSWLLAFEVSELGTMVPTWSLSVEEHFYLVWPLCLVYAAKLRPAVRWPYGVIAVLALLYPAIMFHVLDWPVERLYYAPDSRAGQLLTGCALAVFLPGLKLLGHGFLALPAGILLALYVVGRDLMPPDFYASAGIVLIPILCAVVIAHAIVSKEGWVHTALANPALVWIGQRSYGIYLWNVPLIGALWFLGSSLAAMAVKGIACFLIPALSYRFVEQPFLRMKRNFSAPRPNPNAAGLRSVASEDVA